jgi:hypothetical protein
MRLSLHATPHMKNQGRLVLRGGSSQECRHEQEEDGRTVGPIEYREVVQENDEDHSMERVTSRDWLCGLASADALRMMKRRVVSPSFNSWLEEVYTHTRTHAMYHPRQHSYM